MFMYVIYLYNIYIYIYISFPNSTGKLESHPAQWIMVKIASFLLRDVFIQQTLSRVLGHHFNLFNPPNNPMR